MNEVIIYVRFITGTTRSDPEEAKQACREMLVDGLRKSHLMAQEDQDSSMGLFQVKILGEHAEEL